MKTLTVLAMILALVAMGACGDKNKAQPEKPTPQPVEAEDEAPEPESKPETNTESKAPARSASLEEIIYFEFDSSDLDDQARTSLNENYDWLKQNEARTLTIEGHTDEKGTDEYNLGLGDRRARAAKDYLVRLGIEANRIKVITYGEERPASSNDAKNRRSVFVATRK